MKMRDYVVVIEEDNGAWGAWVPELPGCIAAGKSRDEVRELIREAIELYVETAREFGDPLPPHGDYVETVRAPALTT